MINTKKYILVHCSDVNQNTIFDQYKSINEYHRDVRQFPQSSLGGYVGYHWLITGDKVYRCKMDDEIGAHCNTVINGLSMNWQSLGVAWGGAGDSELPTDTHYKLLQSTIRDLMAKYDITLDRVKFHRDYDLNGKTCPGTLFTRKYLETMISPTIIPTSDCTDIKKQVIIQEGIIANLKALLQSIINFYKK